MPYDFELKIHGKCILAGEHSVLRGVPALVLPVKGSFLDMKYTNTDEEFALLCSGEQSALWDVLFWGVLERACEKLSISKTDLKGNLVLHSNLNLGAGMGASATLCVGVAKLFRYWDLLDSDIYEFARDLEDIFHGESSGVDIAVALEGKALRFLRTGSKEVLKMKWMPNLFLTYSGSKGITSECVAKVKSLFDENESRAKSIDESMKEAVRCMEESLSQGQEAALDKFLVGMNKAKECFVNWDLLDGGVQEKMKEIESLGALAVKPTGSGNGGYILSCWKGLPPKVDGLDFIPVG